VVAVGGRWRRGQVGSDGDGSVGGGRRSVLACVWLSAGVRIWPGHLHAYKKGAGDCAPDDQCRHLCLTLSPTSKVTLFEEVTTKDVNDDEDSTQIRRITKVNSFIMKFHYKVPSCVVKSPS
jgi:hypothetical protein